MLAAAPAGLVAATRATAGDEKESFDAVELTDLTDPGAGAATATLCLCLCVCEFTFTTKSK